MEEGELQIRIRKLAIAFLCLSLLIGCGAQKRTPRHAHYVIYVTPKPFYLPADEDNIYVLASGIKKFCPDGDEDELIRTAVVLIKRVKSDKYPDTLRGVVGEITEKPSEKYMEMAEEILRFGVEQGFPDSMTE